MVPETARTCRARGIFPILVMEANAALTMSTVVFAVRMMASLLSVL